MFQVNIFVVFTGVIRDITKITTSSHYSYDSSKMGGHIRIDITENVACLCIKFNGTSYLNLNLLTYDIMVEPALQIR